MKTWRHVLGTDRTGAFLCAQAAARRMVAVAGGGRIVNVTSIHEHVPLAGSAPCCASNGGMGLLTTVMARELAAHGITVNSAAPGELSTPADRAGAQASPTDPPLRWASRRCGAANGAGIAGTPVMSPT